MKMQSHEVVKYTNGIKDYDVLFPVFEGLHPNYPDTLSYWNAEQSRHLLLARKI